MGAETMTTSTLSLQHFYPAKLEILEIVETTDKIIIKLKSHTHSCKCPTCGTVSTHHHATYIRREAGSYCVQSERHSLTHYPTIDQALMKLLQREKSFDMDPFMPYSAFDVPVEQMWNVEPFIPDALYVPGNGILDEVMRSGDSVAMILPFWHPEKSPDIHNGQNNYTIPINLLHF